MFKTYLEQVILEGFISDKIERLAQGSDQDPKELLDKFNKYRNQHSLDINKFNTLDELVSTLDSIESGETKTSTQYKKASLSDLTTNVDYIEIKGFKNFKAYIPLNYEASKVIASNRVGNCEAKWCTAYQKDDKDWKKYIHRLNGILVYLIYKDTKEAFYLQDKKRVLRFDQNDKEKVLPMTSLKNYSIIKTYLNNNWNELKNKIN